MDRVLGLVFGVFRGLVIVGIAYIAFAGLVPSRDHPDALTQARLFPLIRETSEVLLGMAPGLLVMSALGHQFVRILSEPKPGEFAILFAVVLLWLAVAGGVQVIVARFGNRS